MADDEIICIKGETKKLDSREDGKMAAFEALKVLKTVPMYNFSGFF